MTERSLQVTYRKGRPFAAYLHLWHPMGEKSVKDKAVAGRPSCRRLRRGRPIVGVEITAPEAVSLERLNELLTDLGEAPLAERDYKPLRAATKIHFAVLTPLSN